VHLLSSVEFLSPSDPPSFGNLPSHPSRVWDRVVIGFLIPTPNVFVGSTPPMNIVIFVDTDEQVDLNLLELRSLIDLSVNQ
jgi:hypothetical protein